MGAPRPELPRSALNVKLVKTFSQVLGVLSASSALIPRNLVPFTTKSGNLIYSGVFCTGVKPFWLIIRRDTPPRLYRSSHAVVFGFTSTSTFRSRSDFIAHTEEVRTLRTLQISDSQYDVGSFVRTMGAGHSAWSGTSIQNRPHRTTVFSDCL
jgi:hypothetical protein